MLAETCRGTARGGLRHVGLNMSSSRFLSEQNDVGLGEIDKRWTVNIPTEDERAGDECWIASGLMFQQS